MEDSEALRTLAQKSEFDPLSTLIVHDAPTFPSSNEEVEGEVSIERDNVNDVMKKIAPRLQFKVPNRLSEDDTKIPVELRFESMDDFQPARIAQQVTPLRKLLELRTSLANIRSSMNEDLDKLLQEMIQNNEMLQQAASEAGIRAEDKEKK